MIAEKVEHESKNIIFIYTTCPNIEEARSIGMSAIREKLAISLDYWVIGSIYPWHGVIQDVEQYMLMLTTEKYLSEKLRKFVEAMHSYSTPMIAEMNTALINPSYTFWVESTLSGQTEYISEHDAKIKEESDKDNGYHYGKLK